MVFTDNKGALLEKTLDLLHKDTRTLLAIHTASTIPFYWLRKLKQGGFTNPSVNRVQQLYEFLSGTKLDLN